MFGLVVREAAEADLLIPEAAQELSQSVCEQVRREAALALSAVWVRVFGEQSGE